MVGDRGQDLRRWPSELCECFPSAPGIKDPQGLGKAVKFQQELITGSAERVFVGSFENRS